MEVAALGLKVDGIGSIDTAADSLDRFTKSSKSADQASGSLTTESRNTSKSLADVAREGGKSSASMSKLAGAAKLAAGAFAGIKLTALVSDITMANSRFEQLGLVMGVVGRNASLSQDQVNAYAKEVEAMGISMTESRQTVIKMISAQMDLSRASELARLAQDAAVIANTNSSDALGRLVYGLQSGQVEILRNMGLNVNFAKSYEELAKQLGIATDQLTEADKIQARTNATMAAGIGIAGAYDASMENAGKQLGSTTRYLQDLGVMWGEVFSEAAREAIFGYSDALKGMHATTKLMREDGTLESISKAIGTLARGLVTAAKVAGTFAIAMYAIPALQGAWTLALAAKTAALKLFTAQVVTATGALGLLQRSLMVVAAAFAGVQIGTYLRNEFEIVEKAGIALMGGLHTMAIQVGGYFERLGESISFALTNPLDAFRNKLADLLQSLTGLGQGALRALGLDGFADAIGSGIEKIRSKTGEEHKAMLEQMKKDTQREADAVSDIYADMFADVGRSAAEAVSTTDELANTTDQLGGTVDNLSGKYKALQSAFEQTLADYHRQLNLAEDATLQEQLLYEVQHGRLKGLLPAQQEMLEGMARELDMRKHLAAIDEDEKKLSGERDNIARELMTEEEAIQASYARRKAIVEAATFENEQARTELLLRLEAERNEQLLEVSGSYWERWLQGAEENLTNFNEIAGNVVEGFSTRFGDAFESMIFDAQSLGDAVQGMAQGMLRSVVNAIGQMIAQELAYQAIIALRGPTAQTAAAMEVAAIGTTTAAATAATAATTTTQVAAATTAAAAWTPAAFMASIGSFGAAAAIGIGAVLALGALGGFRKGGYTGDGGVDDVAGVVHGKEFVFDAAATARIGVSNLEAMRAGRSAPASNVIQFPATATHAGAAAAPIINVYEAEGTSATVTTERNEQGQDVISIVLQNLLTDGELATAVNSITGTQYQGS